MFIPKQQKFNMINDLKIIIESPFHKKEEEESGGNMRESSMMPDDPDQETDEHEYRVHQPIVSEYH
jgi:hypothetical protein